MNSIFFSLNQNLIVYPSILLLIYITILLYLYLLICLHIFILTSLGDIMSFYSLLISHITYYILLILSCLYVSYIYYLFPILYRASFKWIQYMPCLPFLLLLLVQILILVLYIYIYIVVLLSLLF